MFRPSNGLVLICFILQQMENQYKADLDDRDRTIASLRKKIAEKDEEIEVNHSDKRFFCNWCSHRYYVKVILLKKKSLVSYNRSIVTLITTQRANIQEHELLQMLSLN